MDGLGMDSAFALPDAYRAGPVLSHRESRLVLRTTHVETGAPRILKCLVPPFPPDEEEAFRSEFLLLDALRHPCWVRPLRYGVLPGGGWFLEMEEAPGVTLPRWPVRGWWPETLAVAHQLLSGLEVLHRLGYAHLDLGPEQVLVESREAPTPWDAHAAADPRHAGASKTAASSEGARDITRVRLLDLGLAAPLGSAIGARGTPGLIAPELLQSRPGWDARVDLYAVGAILFELLTGRPAFPGRTVREVLARQVEGPEPDPGEAAGLPPPVRDLVRELLARDPAARPRSALETWQRLREQAPRTSVGALPPFLMTGEEFAFIGRQAEISAFDAWISSLDSATSEARYALGGERGIGCRRLAVRLGAVAESRGWARTGDSAAPVLRHPRGVVVRVTVQAGDDATVPAEARQAAHGGPVIDRAVDPMPTEDVERVLATAGIESDVLRRRLAALCLGSPGLLAGLLGVLPREIDFATRHAGEDRLDEMLERLPIPAAWLEWLRRLLRQLSPADGEALLHAGVAGLPGIPEGVALGPSELSPVLTPLVHRGLLKRVDGRWRVRFTSWARTMVAADETRAAAIGRDLFADLHRDGDQITRARIGLLLRDIDAVAAALPGALSSLAALGCREEAVLLHASAARLGSAALRGLEEREIVGLLDGVFSLGTRCGSLLPEPGEQSAIGPAESAAPPPPSTAAAYALLDTWAWMGRERRGPAEAALAAAEASLAEAASAVPPAEDSRTETPTAEDATTETPTVGPSAAILRVAAELSEPSRPDGSDALPFLAGWLRYRLLDVERDPEASRAAIRRLRELLPPGERRRQASCDVSEAAILSREGRHEEALRLLDAGMKRLPALEDGEHAVYLHQIASIQLRRGENTPAAEVLARAEVLLRRAGHTVNRLVTAGLLGGVAFGDGDLPRAQAWNEDLLRDHIAHGRWNDAANALGNLSLILLERGRLGEATRAVGDAAALSAYATRPLAARRLASRRIHLLSQCGLLDRAEDEAARFFPAWEATTPGAALLVRANLGEVLCGQERPEAGGAEFRRAVAGFLANGTTDDAAETLTRWGLAETAAGRIAEARDRLEEIEPMRPHATGLTRSAIALLEAETMPAPTSRQTTGDALDAAMKAVGLLEAQDRWSLAWRAHWCLARSRKAAGQAREALDSYETARVILTGIVESLASAARTDGFLRLPAVRSFLEDLGKV